MKLQTVSLQDAVLLQKMILNQLDVFTGRVELLEQGVNSECGPLCLGIDQEKRFVVLLSSLHEEDAILVKALGQLSWVVRHQPLLARLYSQRGVAPSKTPRVILISPSFSKAMHEAVAYVDFDLELYQYRVLELNHERVLLFDRILIPGRTVPSVQSSLPATAPPDPSRSVELTEAEKRFFEASSPTDLPA